MDCLEIALQQRDAHTEVTKCLKANAGVIADSVIEIAAENGHLEVVKLLVDKGGKISAGAVENAIGNDHLEVVKFLLENGGKTDEYSMEVAAMRGNLEIVKYLFGKSGKINDYSIKVAARYEHRDMVEYLIEKGGKISDDSIKVAAEKGNLELVKYLFEKGGKINDDSVEVAVKTGQIELVEYLVEKGGKISDYAQGLALQNGRIDFIKIFMEKGVNFQLHDILVTYAYENKNSDLLDLINKYSVKPDIISSLKTKVDASPLTVVQNSVNTMVKLNDGSIETLKNANAAEVYAELTGENPHNLLKLFLDAGHGSFRFACDSCNHGSAYDKTLGLYPRGLVEERTGARDTQVIFHLNDEQANNVLTFLEETFKDCATGRQNKCNYQQTSHNCVDFMLDVYHAAGFKGDFVDYLSNEQMGFENLELSVSSFYDNKAKGYIYARKHGMTTTIKVAVKAYETYMAVGGAVKAVYDTASDMWHSASDMWHSASDMWHSASDMWHSVTSLVEESPAATEV